MGDGPARSQRLRVPAGFVATVAERQQGLRHGVEDEGGTFDVAHLTFGQQNGAGTATLVADRVRFGVRAALGSGEGYPHHRRGSARLAAAMAGQALARREAPYPTSFITSSGPLRTKSI